MSWINDKINKRIEYDEEDFDEAFEELSSVVMGRRAAASSRDKKRRSADAIGEILKYYRIKMRDLPEGAEDVQDQLEYLLRPSGVMWRTVLLKGKWYKDGIGPLLVRTTDGEYAAIMPGRISGYTFYDTQKQMCVRVNARIINRLEEKAFCFYKPLPPGKIGLGELTAYIFQSLRPADYLALLGITLAVTLLGMLIPLVNKYVFSIVIPSGILTLLIPLALLLLGVTVSKSLFQTAQGLIQSQFGTRLNVSLEAAAMARVLSMPASFFKKYSSGELSSRLRNLNTLCNMLIQLLFSSGLGSLMSLVYLAQIWRFAPALALPALLVLLISVLAPAAASLVQRKVNRELMGHNAKLSGLTFALLSGIQKIKLTGAEKRAFRKWADSYTAAARLQYDPPLVIKVNTAVSSLISMAGVCALYYFAARSRVEVSDYMAFSAAYGSVSASFMALSSILLSVAGIRPVMEMAQPILETEPEVSEGRELVTELRGEVAMHNVSFRYQEKMPYVLQNLSLHIRPGEYVAIVGKTGCGKSTLLRLLLGFETPQRGSVYYDGRDIAKTDLRSLRRNIGAVLQDGKLMQGDLYSNITVAAPWLTLEDAWEAARIAGMAEDIEEMPMQMRTMIGEGGGGISGGQRQRLLIARAIAPRPKILLFDEATSALDNITQKKVADALESLKSTRIVIAHRLSTIKSCDRILVLQKGRISEQGTYEELLEKGGFFAELVKRQRLEEGKEEGKEEGEKDGDHEKVGDADRDKEEKGGPV